MDDSHQPENASSPTPEPSGLSPREAERASLKVLRDHVAKAVEEIVRLRAQNKSLIRRLAESESSGGVTSPVLHDGTDIEEIKANIASFISSIDQYLADQEA